MKVPFLFFLLLFSPTTRASDLLPVTMDTTILPVVFDTLCRDRDPMITARAEGVSYVWTGGFTTPTIPVLAADEFTATITDAAGNVTIDPHRVTLLTVPNPVLPVISPAGPYCEGQPVTVSVDLVGYDSIRWTDGRGTTYPGVGPNNASTVIPAVPGGTITYIAFYAICREQLSVLPPLQFNPEDFSASFSVELLQEVDTICADSNFALSVVGTQIRTVEWTDGDTSRTRSFTAAPDADYAVSVTTFCSDSTAVLRPSLTITDCTPPPDITPCRAVFPEVFTPNRDGRNDVFRIFTDCEPVSYQLRVFNRWGQIVFDSNDTERGWEGDREGSPQSPDVYYYICRFVHRDGEEERRDGEILLLR